MSSELAFEWQLNWRWPCFDTDLTACCFVNQVFFMLSGMGTTHSCPVRYGPVSNGPPGVMQGLEVSFRSSTPRVLGSPSFPFPLWCLVMGCAGDVAWFSSHHMSDPSPSPSHDDGVHAVLVAAGEKMLLEDGLRPEYSQHSSKILGVESGQYVEVAFSHPPAF